MSRWLPIELAPNDDSVILFCDERGNRWTDCAYDRSAARTGFLPLYFMPLPLPPSDTDDLDAQLSPESLADVQAGRQVCRAIYTGLAEVLALESLNNQKGNDDE